MHSRLLVGLCLASLAACGTETVPDPFGDPGSPGGGTGGSHTYQALQRPSGTWWNIESDGSSFSATNQANAYVYSGTVACIEGRAAKVSSQAASPGRVSRHPSSGKRKSR